MSARPLGNRDLNDLLAGAADLPVVDLGAEPGAATVLAILGGGHIGGSFKDLLGPGLLQLAREQGQLQPGQPIIESSSGSMAVGLGRGGLLLGHRVTIVSDPNIPPITRWKLECMGVELDVVGAPDPTLGWQEAREARVRERLAPNGSPFYWTNQNDNLLNPEVYTRWLTPALEQRIDPTRIHAGVFVVGSGGHFSALSRWLNGHNPGCRTVAADRPGSITFGGESGPGRIRGVGNSNIVPAVMAANMNLVEDVIVVKEHDAEAACRALAGTYGLFVGGSSGVAWVAARRVARELGKGVVLTMFPDRGEIYRETIWETTRG